MYGGSTHKHCNNSSRAKDRQYVCSEKTSNIIGEGTDFGGQGEEEVKKR